MRIAVLAFCLLAALAVPAVAQAPTVNYLVISVKSFAFDTDGLVLVTLPSGAQFKVREDEIDRRLTLRVNADNQREAASTPASTATALDVPMDPSQTLRTKCATDWPTDFQMRAFCEKQQTQALAELRSRRIVSADLQTIRNKCEKDWPTDFQMRNYCEEQQITALSALGR